MRARRNLAVLTIALAAIVGGCGGNDSSPAAQPPRESTQSVPPDNAGTETSAAAIRYLALGDSLTQGVGAQDEQTGAFPALLSERWRADGCDVELRNVGVSGYTAGQMVTDQLPAIEDFKPTLITFQAGANDIVTGVPITEYRENIDTVLDSATASGAHVIDLRKLYQEQADEGLWVEDGIHPTPEAYDAWSAEIASAVPTPCK